MSTTVTKEEYEAFETIRQKMLAQENEKLSEFRNFMQSKEADSFIEKIESIETGCIKGSVASSQMSNILTVIKAVKQQYTESSVNVDSTPIT